MEQIQLVSVHKWCQKKFVGGRGNETKINTKVISELIPLDFVSKITSNKEKSHQIF